MPAGKGGPEATLGRGGLGETWEKKEDITGSGRGGGLWEQRPETGNWSSWDQT